MSPLGQQKLRLLRYLGGTSKPDRPADMCATVLKEYSYIELHFPMDWWGDIEEPNMLNNYQGMKVAVSDTSTSSSVVTTHSGRQPNRDKLRLHPYKLELQAAARNSVRKWRITFVMMLRRNMESFWISFIMLEILL